MKTFFTSDSHYSHKLMVNKELLKEQVRPFENTWEMDEALIKNWNSVVEPEDEVYHLGDVSLGNPSFLKSILERLNGKIYLIKGNHDRKTALSPKCIGRFEWVKDYYEADFLIGEKHTKLCMMHYPLASWNKMHYGSFHAYGHCHGNFEHKRVQNSMDVGLDNIVKLTGEYRPISLDEFIKFANLLPQQ